MKNEIIIIFLFTFPFLIKGIISFQCLNGISNVVKLDYKKEDNLYKLENSFDIYFKIEVTNNNEKDWGIEFYEYFQIFFKTIKRVFRFKFDLEKQSILMENKYKIDDKNYDFSPNSNKINKRDDKKYRFRLEVKKKINVYQIENRIENSIYSGNHFPISSIFLNNAYINFIGLNNNVKINIEGDDEPLLCGGELINEIPTISIYYYTSNGKSEEINEGGSVPSDSIKILYLNFASKLSCKNFEIHSIKINQENINLKNLNKGDFQIKINLDINLIGDYTINLSTTKGMLSFKFEVISSGLKYFEFYGHDGIKYTNLKSNKFNWGKVDGDFKISDFNNGYLKVDYTAKDLKNNIIQEFDINEIKKDITLSVADDYIPFEIVNIQNGIYEIQANITKAGKYILESNYFSQKSGNKIVNYYEFIVYENKPSSTSCAINVVKVNQEVIFQCEIFHNEKKGPQFWIDYFNLEFECLVTNIITNESKITDKNYDNNNLNCVYNSTKNGKYEFSAYFILNKEKIKMNSTSYTNQFTIVSPPNSINYTLIYDFYEKKWNNNPRYLNYKEGNTDILAIKFYDDNNLTIPSNFESTYLIYLKGSIYSKHQINRKSELKFRMEKEIDGKNNLIVVYVNDKNFFLKTSYGYNCVIKYNYNFESIKEFEIKMKLNKNGNYDVCDHELSVKNTLFIKNSSIKKVYPNENINIGQILLQTEDNKLYNYKIPEKNISFKVSPSSNNYKIFVYSDEEIDGKYNIYMKAEKSGKYTIKVIINNYTIKNWYIQNEIFPFESISYFNINNFNYTKEGDYIIIDDCSADDTPIFYFNGEDEYNNILNYAPTRKNNNLNIEFITKIDDKEIYNDFEFKYNNDKYEIIDNLKQIGNYTLTIRSIKSKMELIFKYKKIPGKVSSLKSTMNIINNKQIKVNSPSTIEVELKDKYGNNIALNKEKYKKEIKNVHFYIKSDKTQYEYIIPTDDINIKPILKLSSEIITESGFYTLEGIIYGEKISNCEQQCTFTSVHDIFNIKNCKLYALQRDFIELYDSGIFRFNKEYNYPVFKYEFMNDKNELVDKIDPDIPLNLYVQNQDIESKEKYKLEKEVSSLNSFMFYSKKKLNGFYTLFVEYGSENKKNYTLHFLNNDNDSSKNIFEKEYTYVSNKILKLKAGETKYIKLELRTNDNLRYELFDINLLSFDNYNDKDFKINKIKGNKLGQTIIEITCYKISSLETPHEITILYNSNKITSIELIVSPNKLSYFEIDNKSIKDNLKLVDGSTNSISIITLHPYDEFKNENTDIFNSDIYTSEILSSLFNIISQYPVKLSVTTNSVEKTINLKLSTNYAETIQLKSIYLKNIYTMDILAEKVSIKSSGYIIGENLVKSSDKFYFEIVPRDSFGNKIKKYSDNFNFTLKYMKSNEFNEYDIKINPINEEFTLKYEYSFNKVGNYIIKGYLNEKEINNYNNIIYVKNNDIEFEKTKIKYNENLYSSNDLVEISKSSLPFLYLQLYDKDDNIIEDISNVNLKFLFDDSENVICSYDYNNYKLLTICKNSIDLLLNNVNEDHILNIQFNEKSLSFNIKLTGLIDSNTSEDPIDYSKTLISKNTLNLITGEKTQIKITLRTKNKIRLNGYFDNYEEIFDLKLEGIEQKNIFTKEIIPGGEFGTYIILFSCKKVFKEEENTYLNIYINGNKLSSKILIISKSSKVDKAYFVSNDDVKLKSLPDSKADKSYKLRLLFYDKYGNELIQSINEFSYEITNSNKKDKYIESSIKSNIDGSFILTIYPIYSGEYEIKSIFFENTYKFISIAGEINEENTFIDEVDNVIAGNKALIYIMTYDKYKNFIDLTDKNPKDLFSLYYRYKDEENNEYDDYSNIQYLNVIERNGLNVVTFESKLEKKGIYEIKGYINNNEKNIKCHNCFINVESKEMDFEKSKIEILIEETGNFETFISGDYINNYDSRLLIRLYPYDSFGNLVQKFTEKTISAKLKKDNLEYVLSILDKDEFLEISDLNNFNSLEGGEYKLLIFNGIKSIEKNIILSGSSNKDLKELDETKTLLSKTNLNYIAGDKGYIILQLRNKNGLIYNYNENENIETKIISTCQNLNYLKLPSYSPSVIIIINSTTSNTYPKENPCDLSIKVNEYELNVKPKMRVKPFEIEYAEINENYISDKENNKLIDSNVDKEYKIKVKTKDKYDNLVKPNESLLKIQITKDISPIDSLSNLDINSGELIYISTIKLEGDYNIKGGLNSDRKYLFRNNNDEEIIYSFYNKFGEINSETSDIKVLTSEIKAGEIAELIIIPNDQYKNIIKDDNLLNAFNVYLINENNKNLINTNKTIINETKISFTSILKIKGLYNWIIELNGNKIDSFNYETKVNPNIADYTKTLVYSYNKNFQYSIIEPNGIIYSSQDYPLNVYLVLRDEFENILESINEVFIIENINLSENDNIHKQILFNSVKSSDSKRYLIYLNEDEDNKNTFNHLVQYMENDRYKFSFTLSSNNVNYYYNYTVYHQTNKNDNNYGNGFYLPENTEIDKENNEIKVGEILTKKIILKTKENKIYNDDIDYSNYIKCELVENQNDTSFEYSITKSSSEYGIYLLSLSSDIINDKLQVKIIIKSNYEKYSDNYTIIDLKILIGNPDPDKTVIKITKPEIYIGEVFSFYFYLYDKYENQYKANDEVISHLKIINNNILIPESIHTSDNVFIVSFTPKIPPRDLNIQIIYTIDSSNNIILNNQKITGRVLSNIEYKFTQFSGTKITTIKAGESLPLNVHFYDKNKNCIEQYDSLSVILSAIITGPIGEFSKVRNYKFEQKINEDLPSCKIYYYLNMDNDLITELGNYNIEINNGEYKKSYDFIVIPNTLNVNKFVSFYDKNNENFDLNNIQAGTFFNFTIYGQDDYDNKINTQIGNLISIKVFEKENQFNELSNDKYEFKLEEKVDNLGTLYNSLSIYETGQYIIKYYYNEELINILNYNEITTPKNIKIIPGKCSNINTTIDFSSIEGKKIGTNINIEIICKDYYGNSITKGGEYFTSKVYYSPDESSQVTIIDSLITDKNNGTYILSFYPPLEGYYYFSLILDDEIFYLEPEQKFYLEILKCDKYLCKDGSCVDSIKDCLDEGNLCPETKPINCTINGIFTCTNLQTECDCPNNLIKCDNVNYCVENYDIECPFFLPISCKKKYPEYEYKSYDGICRLNKEQEPNKRICPIGYILCSDFTCKTSYDKCIKYPECKEDEIRCLDQSCVSDQEYCPSQISCGNSSKFVCPDGSCVDSDLDCKKLPNCPSNTPYLCPNYFCVENESQCSKNQACGHGKSLCSDGICRKEC